MATMNPTDPIRSDHRFVKRLLDMTGGVEERLEEIENILKVFSRMGGSWERIFGGSVKDIHLLKDIIKYAKKKEHLTKKKLWV